MLAAKPVYTAKFWLQGELRTEKIQSGRCVGELNKNRQCHLGVRSHIQLRALAADQRGPPSKGLSRSESLDHSLGRSFTSAHSEKFGFLDTE